MPADAFLSNDEQEIAKRLAAYHRKIVSMRSPIISEGAAAEGLDTPRKDNNKTRRRTTHERSAVEYYRHARQVQRLLQGVCISQAVSTIVLALVAHQAVLFAFLPGTAFGFAATFPNPDDIVDRAAFRGVCLQSWGGFLAFS